MNEGGCHNGVTLYPKVVYQPQYRENELARFTKFVENKYNVLLESYWKLHEWSCKNYPEFWECMWEFYNVVHSVPYTQVYDRRNDFLRAKWFEGARLNYAENILKYRDSRTALISIDDNDKVGYLTYKQLYEEVKVYVRAMKNAGIRKGDTVACYMPNRVEAIIAFLATATIAARWSEGQCILGVKAILSRFQQIQPDILFTSGNFFYEGTEMNMEQKLPNIVSGLPSLKKVVFILELNSEFVDISRIEKCVFLSDFLKDAREAVESDTQELEFEQVPIDHPLCVQYTSGTTGAPKCLVHPVGVILPGLRDFGLMKDCTRQDVWLHVYNPGWVVWHASVNSLLLGLTIVMYKGDLFSSSPTRIWDLVDRFGITTFYINVKVLEIMAKRGYVPSPSHSLASLKQILPIGRPMKPILYDFIAEKVKKNIFCSSAYGTTETMSMLSCVVMNFPVHKGEIQGKALGMDIQILDDEGLPVIGQRGEVVIANPYPGFPVYMLNDENKEIMKKVYLEKHPGYWNVGDDAWLNPVTKGLIVYGRSDETMKPFIRFNCSEIYFALDDFPGVRDCVCVSQFGSSLNERAVLFVQMESGHHLDDRVRQEIKDTIARHLSNDHVPAVVMETPDIPYNLNGKKLNGLVKKLINKKPITNEDIIMNPSSVDFFKNVHLGEF